MVTIITGTTKKPIASESLKSFFQVHTELEGYLYIQIQSPEVQS